MESTLNEMQLQLEEIKGRSKLAKEAISKLDDRSIEIIQSKEKKQKENEEKQTVLHRNV